MNYDNISRNELLEEITNLKKRVAELEGIESRYIDLDKTLKKVLNEQSSIMDAFPDIIILLDTNGNIIKWNKNTEIVTGYSAEEITNKSAFEFISEEDRATIIKATFSALDDNHTYNDGHLQMKDGRVVPYQWNGATLRDNNGATIGLTTIGRDITEIKAVQMELSKTLMEQESILDALPDILFQVDPEGNMVRWNKKLESVTGFSDKELNGLHATELFTESDLAIVVNIIEEGYKTGYGEIEGHVKNKDGTLTPYQFVGAVIKDGDGNITGATGIGRDITERLEAEERTASSERRFRAIFENANDGIILFNEDIITDANRSAMEMLELSYDEIIGLRPNEVSPLKQFNDRITMELVIEKMKAVMSGDPQSFEWQLLKPDGSIFDTEVSLNTVELEGKTLIQAIIRDITERRRIEITKERLSKIKDGLISSTILITGRLDLETISRETLSTATRLTGASSAIFLYIVDDKVSSTIQQGLTSEKEKEIKRWVQMNRITELCNYGKKAITSKDINKTKGLTDIQKDIEKIESFLLAPIIFDEKLLGIILLIEKNFENDFSDLDKEIIDTLATHAGAAINNARLYKEIISCNIELEEKIKYRTRELENALTNAEIANRSKSNFLASMSHELRTPLNAIIGFSEVLKEQYFGDLNEKQTEYIDDIMESGKHLLNLINDVLDISKVEAGRMELELTKINIKELLENALIMIKEKAIRHNIKLETKIAKDFDSMEIVADERKIKQIIYNLLSNAAKFTPDNGNIVLEAVTNSNEILISVSDSGIGIPVEYQDQIFNEFFQIRNDLLDKTPGTGLGLSLCRKFIDLHDGRIWVDSDGENKGSSFKFTLPMKLSETALQIEVLNRKKIFTKLNSTINQFSRFNRYFTFCRLVTVTSNLNANRLMIIDQLVKLKRSYDFIGIDDNDDIFIIFEEVDKHTAETILNRFINEMRILLNDTALSYFLATYPVDAKTPNSLFDKVNSNTIEQRVMWE